MVALSRILPGAIGLAAGSLAMVATPAYAIVGYGLESGTPLYEELAEPYRSGEPYRGYEWRQPHRYRLNPY